MAGHWVPCQAHAGLHFAAAEVVVFQFRAQCQTERVAQSDLVLQERAEHIVLRGRGCECEDAFALVAILCVAIAHAPDELVSPGECVTVLQVEVERIEIVVKARIVAVGPIIVDAQLQLRRIIDPVLPLSQHVASVDAHSEISRRSRVCRSR